MAELDTPPYIEILEMLKLTGETADYAVEAGVAGLTIRHYRNRPPDALERPAVSVIFVNDEPIEQKSATQYEQARRLTVDVQVDLELEALPTGEDPTRLLALSRVAAAFLRAALSYLSPVSYLVTGIEAGSIKPDERSSVDAGRLTMTLRVDYRVLRASPNKLLTVGYPGGYVAPVYGGLIETPPHIQLLDLAFAELAAADLADLAGVPGPIFVRHYANSEPLEDERPAISLIMAADTLSEGRPLRNMWETTRELTIDLQVDAALATEDGGEDPTGTLALGKLLAAAQAVLMDPASAIAPYVEEINPSEIAPDEDSTPDDGRLVGGLIMLYRVRSEDVNDLLAVGEMG